MLECMSGRIDAFHLMKFSRLASLFACPLFVAVTLCLVNCGGNDPAPEENREVAPAPAPQPKPEPVVTDWTDVKLHASIRKVNPNYSGNGMFAIDPEGQPRQIVLADCGIESLAWIKGMPMLQIIDLQKNPLSDISPLAGLKGLQNLYLESTAVADISALGGMSLDELYLTATPLKDLSPLKTMKVNKLNLVNTPVTDLTPLAGVPIQSLWLTDTPVKDISGLEKVQGLVSLTLHRTQVEDLTPLTSGLYPQGLRLHIGGTPATDVSPLAKVPLSRLVFSPEKITKGMDVIRQLPIREIGTEFEDGKNNLLPASAFWPKYDAEKAAPAVPAEPKKAAIPAPASAPAAE